MRFCPSPSCTYAVKYGRPLEYRDDIVSCSECAAILTNIPPVFPKRTRLTAAETAPGGDVRSRLVVTATAALLIGLGLHLPILGFQTSVVGRPPVEDPAANFSLIYFGLGPFIAAFSLVELTALIVPALRWRRVGSFQDRAPLQTAAVALGAALLVLQTFAVMRFADSVDPSFLSLPSSRSIGIQYLATHVALLGVAFWVTHRGLVNGFALFVLVGAANSLFTLAGRAWGALAAGVLAPGALLLIVGFLTITVGLAVQMSRSSRPAGGLGPTAAPFPPMP